MPNLKSKIQFTGLIEIEHDSPLNESLFIGLLMACIGQLRHVGVHCPGQHMHIENITTEVKE